MTYNDLSPVKDQIFKIRKEIEEIKGELSGKIHSDKAKARVDELETRQRIWPYPWPGTRKRK